MRRAWSTVGTEIIEKRSHPLTLFWSLTFFALKLKTKNVLHKYNICIERHTNPSELSHTEQAHLCSQHLD